MNSISNSANSGSAETTTTAIVSEIQGIVSRAVIRKTDMSAAMQRDAVECAARALTLYDIDKDVAAYVSNKFDEKYGLYWQAIVGRNFRCYVEHTQGSFIYLYFGQMAVVLFNIDKL